MSHFNTTRPAYPHRLARRRLGLCLACAVLSSPARADLHHALEVTLDPAEQSLAVVDTITRDGIPGPLEFDLHPDLAPELLTEGVRLEPLEAITAPVSDAEAGVTPRRYRVLLPAGQNRFVLRYRGRIRHELQPQREDYARGFSETAGMIGEEGVFLADQSYWYPQVQGERLTFDLDLGLPPGWTGMTQGERLTQSDTPSGRRGTAFIPSRRST